MVTTAVMWAVLLLALAGFSVLVARRHVPDDGPESEPDLLRGFAYTGAAAMVALAAAVIIVALVAPGAARADTVAVLGLFGFALYQGIGLLLWRLRTKQR